MPNHHRHPARAHSGRDRSPVSALPFFLHTHPAELYTTSHSFKGNDKWRTSPLKGLVVVCSIRTHFPDRSRLPHQNTSLSRNFKVINSSATPSSQSKEAALCVSCFSHRVLYLCHWIYCRDNTDYCVLCWSGLLKVAVLLGRSVVPSRSMVEYY